MEACCDPQRGLLQLPYCEIAVSSTTLFIFVFLHSLIRKSMAHTRFGFEFFLISEKQMEAVICKSWCILSSLFCYYSIQTAVCGDIAIYATEIYQREPSGTDQRLVFSKFDASELSALFTRGMFMDVFFSLDPYDYQQSAGIRLVAKKLIIHSNWWMKLSF